MHIPLQYRINEHEYEREAQHSYFYKHSSLLSSPRYKLVPFCQSCRRSLFRCHLARPDTQGYGISTQNASFEMKTLCILTQTVTFSYTSINLSASTGHKPGSPRCCGARQFRFLFRLFSFFKLCHFL